MMRLNPSSSMQRLYDDCYLICSTAIYFEKQNNEEEALRSWRDALDQIYYHNAYKIPASYRPRTETEKALQESLRDMEMQCKERVDLLDALRQSRTESLADGLPSGTRRPLSQVVPGKPQWMKNDSIAHRTVPAAKFSDIARPKLSSRVVPPPNPDILYHGPSERSSSANPLRSSITTPLSSMSATGSPKSQQANLPIPNVPERKSRSPSPKKESGLLKSTLRARPKENARTSSSKMAPTLRNRASYQSTSSSASAAAASLAWPGTNLQIAHTTPNGSSSNLVNGADGTGRASMEGFEIGGSVSASPKVQNNELVQPNLIDFSPDIKDACDSSNKPKLHEARQHTYNDSSGSLAGESSSVYVKTGRRTPPPPPSRRTPITSSVAAILDDQPRAVPSAPEFPSYRKEYPSIPDVDSRRAKSMLVAQNSPTEQHSLSESALSRKQAVNNRKPRPPVPRKAVPTSSPLSPIHKPPGDRRSNVVDDHAFTEHVSLAAADSVLTEPSGNCSRLNESQTSAWDARAATLMKNLPRGIDEQAANAIFNEIVIKGDEVHWDDVAGLDVAKNALKEAVVYPFLRPDLFLGLREPARGMLLFGPPGTGKTMLARAVATESKSTFFAISASSLTSKFLGESEKLVRALFVLAKALAPSIIFVDEIDSLLSSRSGNGEHEASRRIKTEFLIQWSDLAKAAAGREQTDKDKAVGDATRVLVLAATNLPWAIDEAARRRFVRRQYIPLPEPHVREDQLRRLMSAQKHALQDKDVTKLVKLTEGFSGSDITALAKDAAMGPLRSLGEQLLHMSPDEIRPIAMEDFEASLVTIRPSVSKQGLKEFENWAREFGERGG